MTAYYNDNDPFAAAWLRELIRAGHIAPGEVDDRSIEDVVPDDLAGFLQCHFFAGIGAWSYALRLVGWPDDRPVWTGSCPCQPFSEAGKREGFTDERHLWPAFFHLISVRRPVLVLGEQVASRPGLAWLDLVSSDLEGAGYACGAVDTCAASVGAPHIRQRLYWVANADVFGRESGMLGNQNVTKRETPCRGKGRRRDDLAYDDRLVRLADAVPAGRSERGAEPGNGPLAGCGGFVGVEVPLGERRRGRGHGDAEGLRGEIQTAGRSGVVGVGDAGPSGLQIQQLADVPGTRRRKEGGTTQQSGCSPRGLADAERESGRAEYEYEPGRRLGRPEITVDAPEFGGNGEEHAPGPLKGFWRDADWLLCRDGRWRPVESGSFPLAHGAPARLGRLRGYGNTINVWQAQAFIRAVLAGDAM